MSNFPISSRPHDYTYSAELCRSLDELQDQRFATEVLDKLLRDLGLPLGLRFASDWPLLFSGLESLPHFMWFRWVSATFWIQSLMRRHHRYTQVTLEAVPPMAESALPDGGAVLVIQFSLDGGRDTSQTRLIPLHTLSPNLRRLLRRRFAEYRSGPHCSDRKRGFLSLSFRSSGSL